MEKIILKKPDLKPLDFLFEGLATMALLGFWFYVITHYEALPETIPTHFDAWGQPDGFGSKSSWFGLPIVGTVLFGLLTVVALSPNHFNFPVQITADNHARQVRLATRLLRWLKAVLIGIFWGISYNTYATAVSGVYQSPSWLLPMALAAVFGSLFTYFILASRR